MTSEVRWFCSLAIDAGLLPPQVCEKVIHDVGEEAGLLVFSQHILDWQLTDDLDSFHSLMSEAYTKAANAEPAPDLNLSSLGIAGVPASQLETTITVVDGESFNWSRLPSLYGVENMTDAVALDLIKNLLAFVRDIGGSDLRLSAESKPSVCLNLELKMFGDYVLTPAAALKLNTVLLTDQMRDTFDRTKDLNFATILNGNGRIRVNLMMQNDGVCGTYRLVPETIRSLSELGFSSEQVFARLLEHQQGLILITGPAGHGKTSTLAALIDILNSTRRAYIITIEEPIEIVHTPHYSILSQREIGLDTTNLETAMRAALRVDPDVVMIGDLRDLDAFETALAATEAGKLVIGTVNTGDVEETLNLLLEAAPTANRQHIRDSIAENLRGIVCQRLIRDKKGGLAVGNEVLVNTDAVAKVILDGNTHHLKALMAAGESQGMCTMGQSVFELYKTDSISAEDALANLQDPTLIKHIVTQQLNDIGAARKN